MSARNIPTEYELTYRVEFSVNSGGKTLIEHEEISATRDISFDEAQLLAKEREQEILREAPGARSRGAGDATARRALNAAPAVTCSEGADVLRVGRQAHASLIALARRFGARARAVRAGREMLPGSYWGESEAGLRGNVLYVRADTPLHSLLHELSHFVCMTPSAARAWIAMPAAMTRRSARSVTCRSCWPMSCRSSGRERMLADMDAWGYTFRLGSARAWFERDAPMRAAGCGTRAHRRRRSAHGVSRPVGDGGGTVGASEVSSASIPITVGRVEQAQSPARAVSAAAVGL